MRVSFMESELAVTLSEDRSDDGLRAACSVRPLGRPAPGSGAVSGRRRGCVGAWLMPCGCIRRAGAGDEGRRRARALVPRRAYVVVGQPLRVVQALAGRRRPWRRSPSSRSWHILPGSTHMLRIGVVEAGIDGAVVAAPARPRSASRASSSRRGRARRRRPSPWRPSASKPPVVEAVEVEVHAARSRRRCSSPRSPRSRRAC